jgi:hypothetical protein
VTPDPAPDPFGREPEGGGLSRLHLASIAVILAAVGAVVIALVTQGGGGAKHRKTTTAAAPHGSDPQPKETLQAFEARLAAAVASPTCRGYRALNNLIPPSCAEVKKRFGGIRFTGAERYGTGAVVDASAPVLPAGITFTLGVATDGRWKIFNAYGTRRRTAETRANDVIPFDTAAQGWLDAVRNRNCDQYVHYAQIDEQGGRQELCAAHFADPQIVAPDLRSAKSADVELLGGNARVQFYALRFGRHYGTLAVNYFPGEPDPAQAAVPIYAR